MSEESTEGAQCETVQVKLDPENFVQEDKDEVLKVSPKRWVIGNELGSDCKSNQELDTEARVPLS